MPAPTAAGADALAMPAPILVAVDAARPQPSTVDLALRYLGLGLPTTVAADEQGRIRPDALAEAYPETLVRHRLVVRRLQPAVRSELAPAVVDAFQQMLAASLHTVFLVGTVICFAGVLFVWLVPNGRLVEPAEAAPTQEAL